MKSIIDYLNMDDKEYKMAKQWETLPEEARVLFVKLLTDRSADFEAIEQELRVIAERYREK